MPEPGQSEHDFLAFCAKIEADPGHWETLKLNFSHALKQRELLRDLGNAGTRLKSAREVALKTFHDINERAKTIKTEAVSYIFADNDILLFADVQNSEMRHRLNILGEEIQPSLPPQITVEHMLAAQHIEELKHFADEKILSARQMRAISALTVESSKRDNVAIQRKNRELPLVMLVEDDRFTAAMTVQLLSKDYDIFHVRTGEEAIEYYLDYAPDAVFIDIHLPGISGNETLQMIRAMDPQAYCVMLSVDTSRAAVMSASQDGANSYLRKPYNKERLLWTVRQSPHIHGASASAAT